MTPGFWASQFQLAFHLHNTGKKDHGRIVYNLLLVNILAEKFLVVHRYISALTPLSENVWDDLCADGGHWNDVTKYFREDVDMIPDEDDLEIMKLHAELLEFLGAEAHYDMINNVDC